MAGHFVLYFTNVAIVATNMRCVDSKIFLLFPPGQNAKSTLYLRLLLSFYTPFRPALNIDKNVYCSIYFRIQIQPLPASDKSSRRHNIITIPLICHFFTRAKFLENKIYTEIYTVNCQFFTLNL